MLFVVVVVVVVVVAAAAAAVLLVAVVAVVVVLVLGVLGVSISRFGTQRLLPKAEMVGGGEKAKKSAW